MLAAVLEDEDAAVYGKRMQRLDVSSIPDWQESAARLRENACDRFETNADGFSAHIDAKEAGLLVFTIPYDPGFSAAVDAQAAAIVPCVLSFMAVWVEAGEHEISFTYRTTRFNAGAAISAASAVLLLLYVLLGRRKANKAVR